MPQDCPSRAACEGAATGELSAPATADVRQGVATTRRGPPLTDCDAGYGSGRRGGPVATSDRNRPASIDDMSQARIADRRKRTAAVDGRPLRVSSVGARRTLEEVPTDAHPPGRRSGPRPATTPSLRATPSANRQLPATERGLARSDTALSGVVGPPATLQSRHHR